MGKWTNNPTRLIFLHYLAVLEHIYSLPAERCSSVGVKVLKKINCISRQRSCCWSPPTMSVNPLMLAWFTQVHGNLHVFILVKLLVKFSWHRPSVSLEIAQFQLSIDVTIINSLRKNELWMYITLVNTFCSSTCVHAEDFSWCNS